MKNHSSSPRPPPPTAANVFLIGALHGPSASLSLSQHTRTPRQPRTRSRRGPPRPMALPRRPPGTRTLRETVPRTPSRLTRYVPFDNILRLSSAPLIPRSRSQPGGPCTRNAFPTFHAPHEPGLTLSMLPSLLVAYPVSPSRQIQAVTRPILPAQTLQPSRYAAQLIGVVLQPISGTVRTVP
jgi:hypothetical protein